MDSLPLINFHSSQGGRFIGFKGISIPSDYGDIDAEYRAIASYAGLIDLSHRGLLQLTGEDRIRFLNGQTTNDVASLKPGQTVYTAFVNAKGKMRADGNILAFADRLWIDVETGCDLSLAADLDKFIIADDVQMENLTGRYVRLAVIGPKAPPAIQNVGLEFPTEVNSIIEFPSKDFGPLVLFRASLGTDPCCEIFCGIDHGPALAAALEEAVKWPSGKWVGWFAMEKRRVELGVPRFGADMDENTLLPEAGIEPRAVSYTKGCYIGQEVISRIKSVGHVNRHLAELKFIGTAGPVAPGSRLTRDSAEIGWVTSCVEIPSKGWIGLGYVKRGVSGLLKGDGFDAMVMEASSPSNP